MTARSSRQACSHRRQASRHTRQNYIETKRLTCSDPGAWRALMERLVRIITAYVNAQIEAGAQVVQLFD